MADTPSRVERVLNLLALLLDTRVPVTQEQIVREVPGYPPAHTAYRRAFERDKETLRAMGVPIATAPLGADPNRVGYMVPPEEYYLPDLDLSAEETAALRLAVTAVSLGQSSGEGALMKLGEVAGAGSAPIASLPLLPVLAPLFEAFRSRSVVSFEYRGTAREVEPWGLASKRGRWYLVGLDRGRAAVRAFRADRITGEVELGPADAFAVPDGFGADQHLEDHPWHFEGGTPVAVRVVVDAQHAAGMVEAAGEEAEVEWDATGCAVVTMTITHRPAFRTFVLGFGEHAEVLDPPELRDELVAWLEALAGSAPGGGGDRGSSSEPARGEAR